MNETPPSVWRKPIPRKLLYLLLFLGVTGFTFYILLYLRAVPDWAKNFLAPTTGALLLATAIGVAALLGTIVVRWLRRGHNLRRTLFVLACLITLLAAFLTEENWRGRRAWEAHRQAGEAKGIKFDFTLLIPPPVPDDQNFAFTPLLKPLLDFKRTEHRTIWADTNGFAHVVNISIEYSPNGVRQYTNELGDIYKGTVADLPAWQVSYRGDTNYPQPVSPGTPAADVLVALGKYDAEIKELRQATATRPYSRYPVEYDHKPPFEILLPHLSPHKHLVRLTHLRAVAELELGRPAEALTDLKVGLRAADSMKDEPFCVSHLVRGACMMIDLQTIREGLLRHAWTDAQLAELDRLLTPVDFLVGMRLALEGEHAFGVSGVEYMLERGIIVPWHARGGDWPMLNKLLGITFSGVFYQNMLYTSQLYEKFFSNSLDVTNRRVFPEFGQRMEEELKPVTQRKLLHPHKIFAVALFPALSGLTSKAARHQTFVDEARVAIAIERYRLAHNQLPESLNALVPQFLDKIPTDVMDGQPLRYRKTDDKTFIIYSIGWDQKDDHGTLGRKTTGPALDALTGDLVWFSSPQTY